MSAIQLTVPADGYNCVCVFSSWLRCCPIRKPIGFEEKKKAGKWNMTEKEGEREIKTGRDTPAAQTVEA